MRREIWWCAAPRRIQVTMQAATAAAIAYSYYLSEADDMIDSFIMNRQVDHRADTKKDSWSVFKYSPRPSKSSALKLIPPSTLH